MAVNSTIKRKTASGYDEIHPKTNTAQVDGLSTALANVTISGLDDIGDVAVSSASSGDFLKYDGTNWVPGTASGADGNNYLTGVSGSGDGTVTFTRTGLSNLTWDASHSHSEYLLTTGKAADSDLLDGINSTSFLRVSANSSSPLNGNFAIGSASSRNFIQSHNSHPLDINPLGNAVTINGSSNTVWHKGNDGSGSGLDADLLDGVHASAFAASSHNHTLGYYSSSATGNLDTLYSTGQFGWANSTTGRPESYGQGINIVSVGTAHNGTNNWITQLAFGTSTTSSYFRTKVNAGSWSSWRTIWNDANDGSGSGLDADLLDGQHGSYYAPLASPSFTGNVSMSGSLEITGDLEVVGNSIGFIDTNFDAKIEVSDANPNNTGAIFDFYGDGVSRNATLSAEQFDGNAATTTKLLTARNIALTGDVTGNANFDGSANISITTAVANDSHTHDGRYYTETESNANFLKRTSTSLLDVNAANGTQLYTGSTGNWTNRGPAGNNAGALLSLNTHSGNYYSQLWFDTANDQFYFRSANGGTGVTTSWQKVWHDGNDGAGSGLAADTLDGQHGSYYAPLASPSFTGTPTAPTPAAGDDDTSIATTAFVQDAIESLVNGASASFDTLKEIQDAMATDTELSNAINNLTIGNGTQTITAGGGLTGGGVFYANQVGNSSVTVSHSDTSSQASVNNSGNTFIQDITLDTYGHITAITSATASTTDSTKLPLAGGTLTGDLVLDHDGTGTAADSHALRFTARAANTDFSREIKLEDGGGFAFDSNILLTGDVTTSNRARTIDFTGFDKEGTTDFSDRAYIQHTTNTGGHSGSVLVISSQNDASDGIAFQTNASSRLKHNSNNIFTDAYHPNADKLTTARNIALTGDVTGSANFDGSGNISITATVADDSHNHTWSNIDGGSVNGWSGLRHSTSSGYIDFGPANTSHAHIYTDRPSFYFNKSLIVNGTTLTGNTGTVTSVATGGGLTGGTITGSGTISHADTSSQASLTALTGANVVSDIDVDTYGHITGLATRALTPANIGAASSSHNHSATEIVTGELNTARMGSGTATSGYVLKSDGDGTASWQQDNNTTYSLGSFGVTATAAELNKMDGVTATTTELNYTDGVTSNIQTQLNSKLSTSAAAAAVSYTTSCPTANNSIGMKVYVGSTDCSTKYTGWLYIVT